MLLKPQFAQTNTMTPEAVEESHGPQTRQMMVKKAKECEFWSPGERR
jgi:hypothetical protein